MMRSAIRPKRDVRFVECSAVCRMGSTVCGMRYAA